MMNKKLNRIKKLQKQFAEQFESETGKSYKETPTFEAWLEQNGHIEPKPAQGKTQTIIVKETPVETKPITIKIKED